MARARPAWLPPLWVLGYYGLLLGALLGFGGLARTVHAEGGFALDRAVLEALDASATPALSRVAALLDLLGIWYALGALVLVVAVGCWRTSRASSLFVLLAFWGATGLNLLGKGYFERQRPALFEPLVAATSFSFPSGHAMGSWAFALAIAFVSARHRPRLAPFAASALLAFALLVGWSRMYLQVHYPSDVLAAWALSSAWVLGLGGWYTRRRGRSRRAEPRRGS